MYDEKSQQELEDDYNEMVTEHEGKSDKQIKEQEHKSLELFIKIKREFERDSILEDVEENINRNGND
jgi:hypothetical protein